MMMMILYYHSKQWNEWENPNQPVKNADSMCSIDLRHVKTGTDKY